MLRCILAFTSAMLLGCGAPPAPSPDGLMSSEIRNLPDPLQALDERITALDHLLAGRASNPDADATLFRLARESAQILSRDEFERHPVLAGRLRTQVFFVAQGPDEERRKAAAEAQELWGRLRASVDKTATGTGERKP